MRLAEQANPLKSQSGKLLGLCMRVVIVLCALLIVPRSMLYGADFDQAYVELLQRFPEDTPGKGLDRGAPAGAVLHQPMTYGLILSSESLRYRTKPTEEGKRRIRHAAEWAIQNARLANDGKPGWGLPQAWQHRPENTSFTITTAIVLEGLLDAAELPDFWSPKETDELLTLVRDVQLRWCRELWSDGFGGGYFHYSPADSNPGWFCINAPAMFLGPMARLVHDHRQILSAEDRQLFTTRMDALAKAIVATATLRNGAPYWDYIAVPNALNSKRPNDLIHQAYILWGIETYRDLNGSVKLPWTRAGALESLQRFWKDDTLRFFAQDEEGIKPTSRQAPANLWGTGMMLACIAKWGTKQDTERTWQAILAAYGPFPDLRVLPATVSDDATFYPRDAAHILFGLAYASMP